MNGLLQDLRFALHSLNRDRRFTVAGLFLSWATTRLIQNQLWNVKATDPWTLAAVTAIVMLVGLLACASPARQASKVDPMVALRYE